MEKKQSYNKAFSVNIVCSLSTVLGAASLREQWKLFHLRWAGAQRSGL